MKARFFLCCGLSALFFGACSEDTTTDATPRPNGPGLVFTGITEGGRTRTQLGDKDKNGNYPTQWIAGDQIAVYALGKPKDYAIYKTENGGETLADFIYESGAELNASAPYFVAYYPEKHYNNDFNQDDKSLEVMLPNTQNYTAGNIEQDAYPMVAVSKGTKLSFKNVLGIVRLNLKSTLGGVKVRKIIISANKPLWGISSITFGDGATAPILNVNEDEYVDTKSMTLDCGEAGVALNADAPTEFMVTLPPAEYKTFRIQVIDTDNKIQSFTANRTISVARSAITTVNLGVNALKSVSTLNHGHVFRYALMRLANNTETPESSDKKIKAIRFVTNSAETSEMIVSDETTAVPAYAVWNAETGEMVIHTAADKIMAHANSNGTFRDMRALTSLDLTGFDTENVTNMNAMFRDSFGLPELDVSKLNTANVTDMSYMFAGCSQLKRLDVSGFKTENATNMSGMFYGCFELAELDVSGFKTENVTDMGEMFFNCMAIKSLDVSGFNTEKVTDMHKLFFYCHQLTALDVSGFKTANVTDMNYMFFSCNQLTTLDLSGFKTEKVTNMSEMFGGCCQLKELDLKTFNTANVTDMSGMFSNCEQLTELDVSMFNTEKVGHIWSMFDGCSKLTSLDLKTFNTANVTNMSDMFNRCESLTSLDLSMFNTEKVEFMNRLFRNCNNLTSLNLGTSFTMDLVSNTDEMCCDMASVSGACTVSCTEETENKMKASNKFPTSGISFVRPQ